MLQLFSFTAGNLAAAGACSPLKSLHSQACSVSLLNGLGATSAFSNSHSGIHFGF
jgi:hypothetical protein